MTPPDGGRDVGSDAAVERPPGVVCPAVAAGETRGLGACCVAATDCAGGVCWDGFCTKTCTGAADCGAVVAPSPLPLGTAMTCAPNQLGDSFSYCLPGSLAACATTGAVACPAGEACALGLAPAAVPPANASSGAYAGVCLTKLIAGPYQPAGSACEPEAGPYACENEGGYLGSGCVAHTCAPACASSADCPYAMFCGPAPYSAAEGGVTAFLAPPGVGVCLGRLCGQVHGQAGLPLGQVTQQGSNAACPTGQVCVPTLAVGAAGDTAYLSCIPPRPAALAFGAACSPDPTQKLRCADDTLCAAGAAGSFCSMLCRTDADCPSASYCLDDYPSPLPNGSVAQLSMCTPRALIGGTACQSEHDCAPTEACQPAGTRSNLLLCTPTAGTKSVGQACAAASECRSGQCVDRDLHAPTGSNRTYCGGTCAKNSDCAANQICLPLVLNDNATTADPTDDVVVGYCTPLDAPPLAGGCMTDADCVGTPASNVTESGGDTCDPVHLTCYSSAARIGGACLYRANCPLGAYCRLNDPRLAGGACLSEGCDPAAVSGVDACPTGSTCAQRGTDKPLFGCYEACSATTTCSRTAEKYACFPPTDGAPASICLTVGGT